MATVEALQRKLATVTFHSSSVIIIGSPPAAERKQRASPIPTANVFVRCKSEVTVLI